MSEMTLDRKIGLSFVFSIGAMLFAVGVSHGTQQTTINSIQKEHEKMKAETDGLDLLTHKVDTNTDKLNANAAKLEEIKTLLIEKE